MSKSSKRIIIPLIVISLLLGWYSVRHYKPLSIPENNMTVTDSPQDIVTPDSCTMLECNVEVTDSTEPIDYSDPGLWCYYGEGEEKKADAFLLCATLYTHPVGNTVLNEDTLSIERAFINRLKGMVSDNCTIYAPAYRLMTLDCYADPNNMQAYEDYAYNDVKTAFRYYLDHARKTHQPIVLLGFSQGSRMVQRLMEDFFTGDSEEAQMLRFDLVGAYMIGWGVTTEFYEQYPDLLPAKYADDTQVIISFEAEHPDVSDSLTVPAGKEYVSINPINWKTDSTKAEASENLGSVLVDGEGRIVSEKAAFCGGYLDESPRHTLKIEDINFEKYMNGVPYLPKGTYHVYDIVFFYRNLQANVNERVNAWYVQHVN